MVTLDWATANEGTQPQMKKQKKVARNRVGITMLLKLYRMTNTVQFGHGYVK
jgi:hypothetical protein